VTNMLPFFSFVLFLGLCLGEGVIHTWRFVRPTYHVS
jgi:hypothetical protein